jgi:hypothetical protein
MTNLIMHANIFPFRQDRHNCMKRNGLYEPLKVQQNGWGDEKRKDDHRPCRKIEIFQFKLMSEHALGYVQI